MRTGTMVVVALVLLSGCARGRVAYRYEHPTKEGAARLGDFAACRFTTGVDEGERFDRCLTSKGYTPVYD